jgi:hypothetical protein
MGENHMQMHFPANTSKLDSLKIPNEPLPAGNLELTPAAVISCPLTLGKRKSRNENPALQNKPEVRGSRQSYDSIVEGLERELSLFTSRQPINNEEAA